MLWVEKRAQLEKTLRGLTALQWGSSGSEVTVPLLSLPSPAQAGHQDTPCWGWDRAAGLSSGPRAVPGLGVLQGITVLL